MQKTGVRKSRDTLPLRNAFVVACVVFLLLNSLLCFQTYRIHLKVLYTVQYNTACAALCLVAVVQILENQ